MSSPPFLKYTLPFPGLNDDCPMYVNNPNSGEKMILYFKSRTKVNFQCTFCRILCLAAAAVLYAEDKLYTCDASFISKGG